ncbi:MAG: phosphoribosylglycinamide synthetase, partial [Planctomycetota bacterium]
MQRAYWLIVSVVVAGCAGGTPPPTGGTDVGLPTPRTTDVGTPSGSPVEKTIGPAGGTLASADDLLTIEVPAGALGADTQLGIQPLTSTAPNGLGSGFRLMPAGTTFSSPVTLTFKPTTEQLAGTVLALTGVGYQDSSGFWRWIRGVERDEANGRVSVTTTHFSDWSLLAGAQLHPPSASVQTGQTLTLTVIYCWTKEELAPLPPLPGEEELA